MNKQLTSYAVVDLEATGTGAFASIIQVGIVIVEAGQVVDTYATDVNPHQALDDHIKSLTGISDEQLAQAPTFSQVAGKIYDLIKDRVFVAHNVHFDANLLAEHLFWEGYELRTPRVDTVELAQVCFPQLDKYNLSALSDHLGLDLSSAHQAIDDARATAQLFLRIQQKLASLPRQTLLALNQLADNFIYETGDLVREALTTASSQLSAGLTEAGGLVLRLPQSPPSPKPLTGEFALNRAALGLEERPLQTSFAQLVAEGYDQPGATVIEGPAGLGKTYGYLLPLLAMAGAHQLVVALPTKLLQDQVMAQEGLRLTEVFQTSITSIKGPSNYLDLDRFAQSLKRSDSNRLINRYKMQLLVWLLETQTGDLDEIRQKQGMEAYFDQLRHCGRRAYGSPFAEVDYWHRLTQAAGQSQVVVTNQAFLLATLRDQPTYLADKVLVVDEAQRFFLAMEAASRARADMTQIMLELNNLLAQEKSLLNQRLLESIQARLSQLVKDYYADRSAGLDQTILDGLRLDLSEYQPAAALVELRAVLAPHYKDFWLETSFTDGKRQTDLVGASLDFLQFEPYLDQVKKAYFISATVAISKRVALPDLLGISHYQVHRLAQSPNPKQAIWVDSDMPVPEIGVDRTYWQAVAERLRELAGLNQPMLVLFTAKQALQQVSDHLETWDINHLAQDKHGQASQVKRRFDRGDSQILLGTGSFWEGADFAQQERLLLVVTKLPFDNPKEGFIKKVNHYLTQTGRKPFYDYGLPLAGLRLKQALGRGQRTAEQESLVLILDGRLQSKSYGRTLIKGLRQLAPLKEEKFVQILSEIREFCYNDKD